MKKVYKLIIFLVFVILLSSFFRTEFQENGMTIDKNYSYDEECTAVIVTGTHAKDGRSILMKNRDMTGDQYQKPTYHASYQGGNYSYVFINFMGMSESGLATMNTAQSGTLINWQYNYHGTYDAWEAMEYILSHFSDVGDAVNWLIRNATGANCIGVIGRNSSVGAFVWISGDHKAVTWVNNSHDAAANNWVPDGVYGSRGQRAKNLLDQFYNEKGYISWEEVMQEISKDQSDQEKTNNNCYSYSGNICNGATWANMVAVSGKNSYEGRLNAMWANYGENAQIGLYLPLMPGVIDSSSDIPSIFTSGNGMGALVEVKRNYARDGCGSSQWNGTRVREIHSYSFYAENYTFKKYDELMTTIPSDLSYSQLKTRLKDYVSDSVVFATNVYISESIPGDIAPTCSISSIVESSAYAHSSGSTLWYSTASTDSFIVNVAANDDNGISKVNFPTTVSAGGDDSAEPYSWTYNWDSSDTYSSTATVTAYDTTSKTGTCSFTLNRDIDAPSTSASITGSYSITLGCSDNSGGSGCDKTYYCIDINNTCNPTTQYSSPISYSCSDICYVRYYSSDKVSNSESIKSTQFGSVAVSKALVLNYNFNESSGTTAHDYSGFNNHGTINGATWISGKHDYALQFDGVNDFVEVPHSDFISGFSKGASFSFWIKLNDTIRRQAILNKYDSSNNQRGWFIEFQNHSNYGKVLGFFASSNGINYSQWYASFSPQIDRWYHISIVWESDQVPKFYVNGQQVSTIGTDKISNMYNNAGAPLHIGKSSYTAGREFNGTIDELKIYNYSINGTEVSEIYSNESKSYFSGTLTDKNGTPLQAVISINLQTVDTKNGDYFISVDPDIYDVQYNFSNFSIPNYWIKLLSFDVTSDWWNALNKLTEENNKTSFVVNTLNNQTIQVYSPEIPSKLKINSLDIPYDESLYLIPSWNYNATSKIITIKFSSQ